jgi:hypothetical protein
VAPATLTVAPAAPLTPWTPPRGLPDRGPKLAADVHKPRIVPIVFPESDNASAAAARLSYIAESVIRRSSSYELVDVLAKLDPAGTQTRTEMAGRGHDAVKLGRQQYDAIENGLGIESFDRALNSFPDSALWQNSPTASGSLESNIRGYEHAATMRILLRWADDSVGSKKDTRHEITNLLTIDLKAEFPRDLPLPADLAQEIQHQRESLSSGPRTSFDIGAEPASARIYIDGVYRGTTPTSVDGLIPGDHFLSLVSPGYEVVQHIIHVAPGGTLTETLKPTDKGRQYLQLVEELRRGFFEPEEISAAQALGQLLGADEILGISVSRHEGMIAATLHRIQVVDGHAAAYAELPGVPEGDPLLPRRVAARTQDLLSRDLPHCDGRPCSFPKPGGGSDTLPAAKIGTGVTSLALLATGISLAVAAKVRSNQFVKLPQTDPTLRAQGSSVFATALASDICNGLGLVSAGIWAYIAFGVPYAQRADVFHPSPLDVPKDAVPPSPTEQKPEKKKTSDDPFDAEAPAPPAAPSFLVFGAPSPGGLTFSLMGSF